MRKWATRVALILLFAELGLQGISFVQYLWNTNTERAALDDRIRHMWAYRDPLYAEIDREESKLNESYQSFVGWQTDEYYSPLINVDGKGVRRTVNNPAESAMGMPTIYFFGGSAMWGVGHTDQTTIPSLVSAEVNKQKPTAVMTNYGEIGFGSTQEVMKLVLLLKSGKRPAQVVFYDGCNDLFLASFDTHPHLTFRDATIKKTLGNIWELPREGAGSVDISNPTIVNSELWKKILSHVQLVRYPMMLFSKQAPQVVQTPRRATGEPKEIERQVGEIVKNYEGNIQILDALSRAYGFSYHLFWQPTLYSRNSEDLSEDEKQLPDATDTRYQEYRAIYKQAAEKLAAAHPQRLSDLSLIFDGVKESVFTDSCHITPVGNTMVSGAITREMSL